MATSMKYFLRALKGNSGSEQELRPSPHQPERCDVVESIEDGKPKLPPFQGDKVLDPHRSLVEKRRNQSVATESCPQEPPQHTERRPSHPTDAPPVPRLDTPESESDDQSDEHHPSPNPLETASKAMAASVPQKSSRDVPPQGASPADRSTPSESFKIKGLDDDMFQTVVNHRNGQQNASNSNSTRTRHRYSSSSAKKSEIDHSRYLKIKKQLDKCDRYCAELEHDNDALKDKNKALSQKYQTLRHDYQQLEEQVRVLQARNDSLEVAHIKSVNSVGTGIQPVSDQEFIKRLGELQSEVNSFFRRMSRHKEIKCDPLEIFPWLNRGSRYNGSLSECGLKVGTILEMVFWAALEQSHNDRVAIPDYGNHIEYFRQLEGWIRRADSSEQEDRTEFWRSYTMSLLTQGDEWAEFYYHGLTVEAHKIFGYLQSLIGQLPEHELGEIFKFVENFFEISTDLSRQRPWYEFNMVIVPGWDFDSNSMEDFKNIAEDDSDSSWIVEAVVSRGLVRKQCRFTSDVQKQVIKTRVTLGRRKASYV